MKYLAKYISETMAEVIDCPANENRVLELIDDGFVEFVPDFDMPELAEGEELKLSYILDSGKVIQVWGVVRSNDYYIRLISDLKGKISDSDYKVMKCYEYSMAGQELPYDIAQLHAERQALRDEINRLEQLLQP